MSQTDQNYEREQERKGFLKGTALGVAIGGAIGAVAGVLFAPQAGRETRAQLVRTMQAASRQLDHQIKEIEHRVKDFSDAAGKDLSELLDRAIVLKDEIITFARSGFGKSGEISAETKREAMRLLDESKKVAADLDRVLTKKLSDAGDLAANTAQQVKQAKTTIRRDVKK